MNMMLQQPWTTERFLDWAETQEEPYEFDGTQPVATTGGNRRDSLVMHNLYAALRVRLRGSGHHYAGLLVFRRQQAGAPWTATPLTVEESLDLPAVGATIPVAELYEDVEFARADA